jgi:hypothetical protein
VVGLRTAVSAGWRASRVGVTFCFVCGQLPATWLSVANMDDWQDCRRPAQPIKLRPSWGPPERALKNRGTSGCLF